MRALTTGGGARGGPLLERIGEGQRSGGSYAQQREPLNLPYLHSWTAAHLNRLLADYQASVKRETPIPAGAPLDFVPAQPPD